jgi:hypothetical protein
MRDWVRVDQVDVLHLVDQIAEHAGASGLEQSRTAASAELAAAVDSIRHAVRRAPRLPFTDQVRLPGSEVVRMVDSLRGFRVA